MVSQTPFVGDDRPVMSIVQLFDIEEIPGGSRAAQSAISFNTFGFLCSD